MIALNKQTIIDVLILLAPSALTILRKGIVWIVYMIAYVTAQTEIKQYIEKHFMKGKHRDDRIGV